MNCLRLLEQWDRGLESQLRHGCLCVRFFLFVLFCVHVAALRRADPPSMESYRLYEKIMKLEKNGQIPAKACRARDEYIFMYLQWTRIMFYMWHDMLNII
jgi:hypothetical protein